MSHKRKVDGDIPTLTATSLYDEAFPNDLFIRVGGYWTGKELSTYLLAAAASQKIRDCGDGNDVKGSHLITSAKGIIRCIGQRCLAFLDSISAPDSMKNIVKDWMGDVINNGLSTSKPIDFMQSISKWCGLVDYCESTPLRLSEARLEQDQPIKPLWIVGAGEFSQPNSELAVSPCILSVPNETWRPELIFLGEKWMGETSLDYSFMMDFTDMVQNIGHTAAVMSWKDGRYLSYAHQRIDIAAGMIAFHLWPNNQNDDGSFLNWLSKEFCESMMASYAGIRRALGSSHLKWMVDGTKWDNNMLASVEINDTHIPNDHMVKFGERILKLLKEVDQWYEYDSDEEED